jgi:hypothetical protein
VSVTLEFYDKDGSLLDRSGVAGTSVPTNLAVPAGAVRLEMTWPGVVSPAVYDLSAADFAEITIAPAADPPQILLYGAETIDRLPVDWKREAGR